MNKEYNKLLKKCEESTCHKFLKSGLCFICWVRQSILDMEKKDPALKKLRKFIFS